MAAGRDHYQTLGVSPGTDPREIKAAYRKLALQHHPDCAGSQETESFQQIAEAYTVLSDPQRRAAYDEQLRAREAATEPFQPPLRGRDSRWPPPEPMLASQGWGASSASPFPEALRGGPPLGGELVISSALAEQGGVVRLAIPTRLRCPACQGHGLRGMSWRCSACEGSGTLIAEELVELALPAGLRDGSRLRLVRRGQSDLLLGITVRDW